MGGRGRESGKSSEINTGAVSGGQNELVGKLKMAEGNLIGFKE